MITKDRLIELAKAKAEAKAAYAAAWKVADEAGEGVSKVDADINARHWLRLAATTDDAYAKALDEYMKQEASNG